MVRKLLILATAVALLLSLTLAVLWYRAKQNTDVFMLAMPGGNCLLIKSHEGRWGWMEISGVHDWPDRGFGLWSANRDNLASPISKRGGRPRYHSWERAGPFLFWQRHTGVYKGSIAFIHGTLVVPTDDGGKLPAYGDGYDRADAANAWSGVIPGQQGWLFLSGWEVRIPHTYLIALTAPLPLVVIPVWLMRLHRRRQRAKRGLCGLQVQLIRRR